MVQEYISQRQKAINLIDKIIDSYGYGDFELSQVRAVICLKGFRKNLVNEILEFYQEVGDIKINESNNSIFFLRKEDQEETKKEEVNEAVTQEAIEEEVNNVFGK